MAENIVDAFMGGVLGEAADAAPAAGLHPFAAALAADMSRHDPEVAAETAFLRHQTARRRVRRPRRDQRLSGAVLATARGPIADTDDGRRVAAPCMPTHRARCDSVLRARRRVNALDQPTPAAQG